MALTTNDIIDALTKAAAYDAYHTPKTSHILLQAWKEHFDRFTPHATRQDILEAVTVYHRITREHMLQPADLSAIIRAATLDNLDRQPAESPPRIALEARSDAKATDTPGRTRNRAQATINHLTRALEGLKPGEDGAREFLEARLRYHTQDSDTP